MEVARQLSDVGEEVKGIILIDSPCPINHEPLPDPVIEHVIKVPSANGDESVIRQSLLRQFRTNAAMLGMYRLPPSAASAPYPKIVMLRSQDIFDCEALCGVHYPWLSSQEVRSDTIATWEMLVDQHIQVLDIPGNHFEAFSPQNVRGSRSSYFFLSSSLPLNPPCGLPYRPIASLFYLLNMCAQVIKKS